MGESYYTQEAFWYGVYDNLKRNTENNVLNDILKELKEINSKLDSNKSKPRYEYHPDGDYFTERE